MKRAYEIKTMEYMDVSNEERDALMRQLFGGTDYVACTGMYKRYPGLVFALLPDAETYRVFGPAGVLRELKYDLEYVLRPYQAPAVQEDWAAQTAQGILPLPPPTVPGSPQGQLLSKPVGVPTSGGAYGALPNSPWAPSVGKWYP